jgi:uncharacterized membrane protein HdeD (DUF308 family)
MTITGTGSAREDLRAIGRLVLTHALARNWWLLLLRGIVGVVFGVVALFWPGATLLSLIFLWGAYAIADGAFSLWAAITGRVGENASRWWLAVAGVAGIAAGVIAWAWPGPTALALLVLVAAWAIATGVMQVWGAIRLRKEIDGEWLLGLSGSLSILLGVILLLQPAAGALAVVWWIGVFAIVMGLAHMGLALRLRKLLHAAEERVRGRLDREAGSPR